MNGNGDAVMGVKPEDMRYEIGTMVPGGEPWLCAVGDVCTLDCVSGAHRPGCGWEPLAPVRELRVAYQRQNRHRDLVEFCERIVGADATVRAVSGDDPNDVRFTGRAVGYQDLPSVIVELGNGTRRQWVAPLLRVESPTSVWDSVVPPGGMVCTTCGIPVETEPCPDHGPPGGTELSAGPCPMETPDALPGRSS